MAVIMGKVVAHACLWRLPQSAPKKTLRASLLPCRPEARQQASTERSSRRLVQPLGRIGEDLRAGLRHADHVLELSRERAVAGYGGPAVGQDLHLRPPE